jgi:hypothetical protein
MKVMEVYVQETTALLYLKRIPKSSRQKVLSVTQLFPPDALHSKLHK